MLSVNDFFLYNKQQIMSIIFLLDCFSLSSHRHIVKVFQTLMKMYAEKNQLLVIQTLILDNFVLSLLDF